MAITYHPMLLGDVVRFGNGKSIKPGGEGRYPVFGSNGVIGGSDEYRHENGIIIGRVGAYCGSVAYCPDRFWASDNTLVAFPASDGFDTKFIYYLLADANLSRHAGGAAQPLVTQTVLKQIRVSVPPLPIQRRIAGILSAYDELIENSQRRIRILEAMARGLYREWFVHFRFPGHEEHPRVASAVGEIPAGWELKLVKDILVRRGAGTVYREVDVKQEGAIPVLDQSSHEILGYHDNEADHFALPESPLAIFGDHTCKMQLLLEPFSVGPNVVPFAANPELPTAYVFYAVHTLVQTQEYKRHWIPLNVKEVIVADCITARHFALLIQPMLVEQNTLRKITQNLRRTRDLLLPRLLPRLLAGQVDVEET
jgi:type I restriction enzyme S subunit